MRARDVALLGGVWSPRRLFAAGEQGVWYDPSDLTSMYQDSAGTTAAAVGQPVGLMLDKSRSLVRGSELVADPSFDNAAAWTASAGTVVVSGGNAVFTSAASGVNIKPSPGITLVTNSWYVGSIDVTSVTGGALRVANEAGVALSSDFSTAGAREFYFLAPSTSSPVLRAAGTTTAAVASLSVKPLAGNHASQATPTSRPTLQSQCVSCDGTDDFIAASTGGGGTTGFLLCAGIKVSGGAGGARHLWSDAGTNAGYRVGINASNQLELAAGNGSAFTTIATTATLPVGEKHVVSAWDDGINLNVQIDGGTIHSTARPSVTAGTTGFTMFRSNASASFFFPGELYCMTHRQTDCGDSQRQQLRRWTAQKTGVSL